MGVKKICCYYWNEFYQKIKKEKDIKFIELNNDFETHLKELDLSDFIHLRRINIKLNEEKDYDNEISDFIDNIRLKLNITTFEIIHIPLSSKKIYKSLRNFIENSNLKKLILSENMLYQTNINKLIKSISKNKSITYLDLSYNEFEEDTLSDIIDECKSLKTIIFDSNNIGYDIPNTSISIKNNNNLKKLSVQECSFDKYDLFDSLKYNFSLTELRFSQEEHPDDRDPIIDAKIQCLLDLNKNWELKIDEASYPMICEKIKLINDSDDITIFSDKSKKNKIKSTDTYFLYWILNHHFPKDIIWIILEYSWWLIILNENKIEYQIWKNIKS
jgi:hypothetical protein